MYNYLIYEWNWKLIKINLKKNPIYLLIHIVLIVLLFDLQLKENEISLFLRFVLNVSK